MASHFPRRHAPRLSYYYIAVKQRRLARIREIMHQHALKDMLDSGCQAMLAILKLLVTLISVWLSVHYILICKITAVYGSLDALHVASALLHLLILVGSLVDSELHRMPQSH